MKTSLIPYLNRVPDEQIGENFFFHTDFDEQLHSTLDPSPSTNLRLSYTSAEEYYAKYVKELTDDVRNFPETGEPKLRKILSEIAADGELVLNLASDRCRGMILQLLQYNPTLPIYLSDINERGMRMLGEYLQNSPNERNIRVASFDNNNIPIRDNSLKYITSIDGMTISGRGAVAEVYRILQPGGYFVTLEQFRNYDCDLMELYESYQTNGNLYGQLSFDEIKTVLDGICENAWKTTFTSAGFEIVTEREFYHRMTPDELKKFLRLSAEADESALNIYEGFTLYILRKPEIPVDKNGRPMV